MKKTTMPYTLSLNGRWVMDWLSDQPYTGEEEPQIRKDSDSAVGCPVPGYCGRQFEAMLNQSHSVVLEVDGLPHSPILDIASSYKNACREAMMAEYRVGRGKLLICSLHLSEADSAARWLKGRILAYAAGDAFQPTQALTEAQFADMCKASPIAVSRNTNEAMNKNDITMLV